MSKKKISNTVWIVASIVGVAILGVGGYFAFRTPNSKASDNPELLGGTGASDGGLVVDILNTASNVLAGNKTTSFCCFDEFGGYYKKNNKNWGE
ncbi:MAG: hypothetical protein WCT77_00220 [Bacteroidota bacterium]|jgi:hypothetical protein